MANLFKKLDDDNSDGKARPNAGQKRPLAEKPKPYTPWKFSLPHGVKPKTVEDCHEVASSTFQVTRK
jgi:hypothetical protein